MGLFTIEFEVGRERPLHFAKLFERLFLGAVASNLVLPFSRHRYTSTIVYSSRTRPGPFCGQSSVPARRRLYVFDPLRGCLAYCFRMVLLQIVKTGAKLDDSALIEPFRKVVCEYGSD